MRKNTKILIIGFGSIGSRHYQNLKKMGFGNVYVYDIDQKKTKDLGIKKVDDISLSSLKQFDVAFICSPNHLHIEHALKSAKAGCRLFIEKPLSHNFRGVKLLAKICQEKKIANMVACNMRFHPCLKFIKDYLDKGKLGKVHCLHLECGYYLPYWRPEQDYRQNYASKKRWGGGIILDDIHEFDLLFWLNDFKKVKESKFIFDKVSDLKIETEDCSIAAFKFSNKVLASVRSDYLQQAKSRNVKVIGEKGNLEWDFKDAVRDKASNGAGNIVWLKQRNTAKKLFQVKKYNNNQMYIEELKYFFNCLSKRQPTFNTISHAAVVLKEIVTKKYEK